MRRALAATLTAAALAVPAAAPAATLTVNTVADDAGGDCKVPGQPCSLRRAILDAAPAGDEIVVPAGLYSLTGSDLIVTIGKQLAIRGAGARTTEIREVSGGDGRVFLLEMDSRLDLSGVTLTGARASAVLLFGTGVTFNATGVAFTGNLGRDGAAIDGTGGAVTLVGSTISGNTAKGIAGNAGRGGGVFLGGSAATLSVLNSTITQNAAGTGGGVAVERGSATLTHSTVTGNLPGPGTGALGGEVYRGPAPATISAQGSILGGCTIPAITSQGANLSPGTTCGLGAEDLSGVDPQLGPLQNNGGPTDTMAPAPGSQTVDRISTGCPPPATDQRGVARPKGGRCDIGAVEIVAPPPAVSRLRLAPFAFRAAGSGGPLSTFRRAPVGARVSFRLDRTALVRFGVERVVLGRRVGRRCLLLTRANRNRPRCYRFPAFRTTFVRSRLAGAIAVILTGRLDGRRLAPGYYRLTVTPSAAGHTGRTVRAGFRVIP